MPIRVCALGNGMYVLRDGRHRIQAHIEAGFHAIFAVIENLGTKLKRFTYFLFSR